MASPNGMATSPIWEPARGSLSKKVTQTPRFKPKKLHKPEKNNQHCNQASDSELRQIGKSVHVTWLRLGLACIGTSSSVLAVLPPSLRSPPGTAAGRPGCCRHSLSGCPSSTAGRSATSNMVQLAMQAMRQGAQVYPPDKTAMCKKA